MSGWPLSCLVVALVSAVMGFGGAAGTAAIAAKVVFFAAIGLFAVGLVVWAIAALVSGRHPPVG